MGGMTQSNNDQGERWAEVEAARARAGTIDTDWQQQARERDAGAQEPLGLVRQRLVQARQQPGADALAPLIEAIEDLTNAVEQLIARVGTSGA